jgi:glycosyltransferase involved in cell wall biosynthesis
MIGFFHQHNVIERQGGIERYVNTLLSVKDGGSTLFTLGVGDSTADRVFIRPVGVAAFPVWLRYSLGCIFGFKQIRRELKIRSIDVIELSRPEYVCFAWLLPGVKVITIHGTGPTKGRPVTYAIHVASTILCGLLARRIQVVGFDKSGIPRIIRHFYAKKIVNVHAWYDDAFSSTIMPSLTGDKLRVVYAGRLGEQKDPALFAAIVKSVSQQKLAISIAYCGSDQHVIREYGIEHLVSDHGLLDAGGLARLMRSSHCLIMTSSHGEGSPFIIIEALACGRYAVLPELLTLKLAYAKTPGVIMVAERSAKAFIAALERVRREVQEGASGEEISSAVAGRSKERMALSLLAALEDLAPGQLHEKQKGNEV